MVKEKRKSQASVRCSFVAFLCVPKSFFCSFPSVHTLKFDDGEKITITENSFKNSNRKITLREMIRQELMLAMAGGSDLF